MKPLVPALLVLLVFTGCASTMSSSTNDAQTYIQSTTPRFISSFNSGDWNAVSGYYADDAVLLMPNADAMRGTAAIRAGFNSMNGMNARLNLTSDRVVQSGDLAYETGTYTMSMTPSGGNAMNDRGKYLTVWRRQADGTWKIVADAINTSMPGHM